MNNSRDLIKRLLSLYPIKHVKEHFGETGNASEVIEVVSGNFRQKEIYAFAQSFSCLTRQHIYLLQLNRNLTLIDVIDFPLSTVFQQAERGGFTLFCLPKTSYSVSLINPLEESEIVFQQPVTITLVNKVLSVFFTKIEKNVTPYYPEARYPVKRAQKFDEDEILRTIVSYFQDQCGTVACLDINKGIKYLWDNSYIDSNKVQWMKASSNATETMHEKLLFKRSYPAEYDELIKAPLVKSYFKYIREDDNFCEFFDADPGTGQVNIPRFPKTENQVNNVIREILAHN